MLKKHQHDQDQHSISYAQQRMWLLDRLDPQNPAYNITRAIRMRGSLSQAALQESLRGIVTRHESLRTTFTESEGEPIPVVAADCPLELSTIDLNGVAEAKRESEVLRLTRDEAQRPFDLDQGPLLRIKLLRLSDDEHILILTMHHIITDAWSMRVFFEEMGRLYEAFVAGLPSPLPDLPMQYRDFARQQRESLMGETFDRRLAYWRHQLAGIDPVLALPTDRNRPVVQTSHGAIQKRVFSRALRDGLKAVGRESNATLFMTLLAVFQTLLFRYTGRDDLVIGSPTAGRSEVELESLIGLFVNTLAIRTNLSGNPTFRELLGRVRKATLEAYDHQEVPFEKIIEALHIQRNMSYTPLFQVMFILQNAPKQHLEFPWLTLDKLEFDSSTAKFDLTVDMAEVDDGLSCILEYNTDLFESATIMRMLGHFQSLLEGIVFDPGQRLLSLPLMSEPERHQLLVEWNETAVVYPCDQSIHSLFEDQVDATPNVVALVAEGVSLTYRELDRRANRLAHYLCTLGIGPERLVGVCMERSVDMIVALLGILKAGGAYAPFDLLAPPERLAFMLSDAKIDLLLTHERMLARFPEHELRTVCLDVDGRDIQAQPDTRLGVSVGAEGLAYVMYTSGSTGEPKGVAVTHRSVVRLVKNTDYAHFGPDEVFLQFAALAFDASTFEIWGALLNGGRLALAPPGVLSLEEVGSVIARYGVTTLWLTAGLFHQVVDLRIEILRPVRQLLAGGDVLSPVHVKRVLETLPGCRLINGYGPTEGTTFTCYHTITNVTASRRTVPIGRPIANTRVYVLDRSLHPVPIGVPGELWIAGDGLARGYINRPELTAERFVTHRFSETLQERLYRSGDLVRWLDGGEIEFLGRLDNQVKVRGFRVEMGEIEAILGRHPSVQEAVVVTRPTADGDKRLVAYVVANSSVGARDFREFLGNKLPEYMIPTAFVALDRLPLTANGKVDRQALPEPETNAEMADCYVGPRDELERQLVKIWQDVLSIGSIGVNDNFFDLGGHSLLAVRIFARLTSQLQVMLPPATLFQAPTVAGLAVLIREGEHPASGRSLVPIQPTGSRPPLFGIPGVGGNVLCYHALAQCMGPDQPFYGLQSRGLDGTEKPLTRIEDIASEFLREICEVQPVGPYYLIGACMGGVVAYEMAQQMRAIGQEVALLVLLDTPIPNSASAGPPGVGEGLPTVLGFAADRLHLYLHTLAQLSFREQLQYLLGRMKLFAEVIIQWNLFRGDRTEFYLNVVTKTNFLAFQKYEPQSYPGPVVHFYAEGRQVAPADDDRLAWREFITGELAIYNVPGNDSGQMLVAPQVQLLAPRLKTCLDRAQASSGGKELKLLEILSGYVLGSFFTMSPVWRVIESWPIFT